MAENEKKLISTKSRLVEFNEQIKLSLNNGIKFTETLDILMNTQDKVELIDAAMSLMGYQLDTSYLTFPQKYSAADYCLLFFNRLMDLHDNETAILHFSEPRKALVHEIPGINAVDSFSFKIDDSDGAYYVAQESGASLFYLNLRKRMIRINSSAITNVLIVSYLEKLDAKAIKHLEMMLIDFATYLKEDYGFSVDLNLLDSGNPARYELAEDMLKRDVIDELFVLASENELMVEAGANNSAVLKLANSEITIYDQKQMGENDNEKWVIAVMDTTQEISWFDILLNEPFIRNWYLNNISELSIKSDPLIFK
ncbi:hypothetical protein [Dellaglioa algida]|uniref:Uncharacterized protein n=1 Tax=Dellaglioa algida TaxID=105612 RepID=A0A5C6MC03_9LACO|nr:hypothetical protein [Dellaglioa algida]MDK1716737.1 hypothetical protein [Dellaglioa algida]MDK1720184.1 hypothetical protein [Dellaglioa algida]MDK1721679.1 hypothetical protein [Dellaglioa algida]MDK1723573.1 hypothetical protein [Dellaglioa algida]MDK1725207.1 hypothetical protein [Dellaglioa algida]